MQVLDSTELPSKTIQLQHLDDKRFAVATKPQGKVKGTNAYFNNEDTARSFYDLIIQRTPKEKK